MRPITRYLLLVLLLLLGGFSALAQDSTEEPAPTAKPRPLPETTLNENGAAVELYFDRIPQGQVGLVHVTGNGIATVRARVFNRLVDFFSVKNDGYYGLIAAGMEQNPRTYDLSLFIWHEDGERVTITTQVEVTRGRFIRQDLAVGEDRAYLIDPQVERGEFARLDSVVSQFTTDGLWDSTFQYPIDSELTSPFGAFRTINETVQTRHTGWDMRAPVGVPVKAMGGGRVAYAGQLDIRGNFVLIDHGYGVFSGYAHMSQVHVTRGQSVVQGQIIGVTGNSGRSNGPHMHWEVIVDGQWVDSVEFVQMWLPTAP